MSLDKAILHGKEYRKPYRGAKAYDKTCRNHGDCPSCSKQRKQKDLKRRNGSVLRYDESEEFE